MVEWFSRRWDDMSAMYYFGTLFFRAAIIFASIKSVELALGRHIGAILLVLLFGACFFFFFFCGIKEDPRVQEMKLLGFSVVGQHLLAVKDLS